MLKRVICSLLCMLMIFSLVPFQNVKAEETTNANKTMGDMQEVMEDYLAENHPDIKIGTQAYFDYVSEQKTTGEDKKLMERDDYNDLSTYMGKYMILVDEKQCYLTDEEQILNLSEEEKAMTLQEVRQEAIEEEKEDLAWEKKLESQPPVMTRASSYNATNAVNYAKKWAEKRNDAYDSYSNDCTNFISQALYAGGISMRKPSTIKHGITDTTDYWFSKKHKFTGSTGRVTYEYDVTTSWMRVKAFYQYASAHGASVSKYDTISQLQNNAKLGDIVQLKDDSGWYHSIIITGGSKGNRTYCGHTSNKKDHPVADLNKKVKHKKFRIIRF
ncbi:MAG TPA: amidase domain-containing protein [Candidatus Anaerobutyricum stercoris]|uniref:Amidase domain-containing protein n=1 Tax=Candidatus Anaerobutyricum stercoris TaxID=2838457 RepID=A0A9D2ENV0_9FIRM|nr:amidase domain-containing protein [Candidatus Anaerobutyricum stercoris]